LYLFFLFDLFGKDSLLTWEGLTEAACESGLSGRGIEAGSVSGVGLAGKGIEAGSVSGSGLAGKAIVAGSIESLLEVPKPCPKTGPVVLDGDTFNTALPDKALSQVVNRYQNQQNIVIQ
jgi:hypothetical protein